MQITPELVQRLRGTLSQKAFAKKLGCTWQQVSRWEHGHQAPSNVYADKLRRLARREGISA